MKKLFALGMVCGFVFTMMARAEDKPAPAVDPAKLAAFMEKWRHFKVDRTNWNDIGYILPKTDENQPLLLAAFEKDPEGEWFTYFFFEYSGVLDEDSLKKGIWNDNTNNPPPPPSVKQRQAIAAKDSETLQQGLRILDADIQRFQKAGYKPDNLKVERHSFTLLLGSRLLEAGSAHLPEAQALGKELLAHLPETNSRDYGFIIFIGNNLLGHVALREGKLEAAREYLRKAGRAPVGIGLIGPNNTLASEVLQHGETADREAVLAYLSDIATYLENSHTNNSYSMGLYEDRLKVLEKWKAEIRAGKTTNDLRWH